MKQPPLLLEVYRQNDLVGRCTFDGAITLGRQQELQEPIGSVAIDKTSAGGIRLAIESAADITISRRHVRLEAIDGGRVSVESPSRQALYIENGPSFDPSSRVIVPLPCRVNFGPNFSFGVHVSVSEFGRSEFQSLTQPAPKPNPAQSVEDLPSGNLWNLKGVANEGVGTWLRALVEVLQSAVSSEDFYQRAAAALVRLIDLDSGRVLIRENQTWRRTAGSCRDDLNRSPTWPPSMSILDEMCRTKSTVWKDAIENQLIAQSQIGFQSFVAAPILDRHGEVLGALYGDRREEHRGIRGLAISRLEAQLVETLAYGVSVGLERLAQEKVANQQRVRFEQFFTSKLADELARHPDLLEGRDAEITVLFCDIRGFSKLSQSIGTKSTMELIRDVMQVLSESVLIHEGVVVDYIGDELIAMWGAPAQQDDQAVRACRAALDMLNQLPELNQRWRALLNGELDFGIGINTGLAQVGNIGSSYKFKYGPLGHAVNLASRVQGVNKYLRTRLLVTEETFRKLPAEFAAARRICSVRVVNVASPVELYEIRGDATASVRDLFHAYERALFAFESKQFSVAAKSLGGYLPDFETDMPSIVLLSRTVNELVDPSASFDKVWEVPGK